MAVHAAERELMEEIARLTPGERYQVLRFVKEVAGQRPTGVPGPVLLQRIQQMSPISHEELEEMERAIEEGCEQVDSDGW